MATARTVALQGATGHLIDVQVDVSPGMVGTTVVGRPDTSLTEARDRCRMAVNNSGLRVEGDSEESKRAEWPATRRVTILLSPADLPKSGTHFDLAIAVATLAAAGFLPAAALDRTLFVGELTLSGGLRSVPGVLPMVMAAVDRGIHRVFVPEPQSREAALVPGTAVLGVRSLAQVVSQLRDEEVPEAPPVAPMSGSRLLAWRGQERLAEHDLGDLLGMADARFALEVAAAGGHHLMLSGPRGAGKTTLAERIPGILPDLTLEESLELMAIHSLAGALDPGDGMISRPPFFAPHHDASLVSLIGGGSGRVRPGEISRAHNGVLFLDEFPLFRNDVIQALRQPLESGEVTIARGEQSATFPARGIVVLAANPCPCGDYDVSAGADRCLCTTARRNAYRAKFTGPIADRIDIVRHVRPVDGEQAGDPLAPTPERSEQVRARVTLARERQAARYAGRSWRLNGQAPGATLREEWPLTELARKLLDSEMYAGRLTRRGGDRVHRMAWTITDLWGTERPGADELDVALRLRQGAPLLGAMLGAGLMGTSRDAAGGAGDPTGTADRLARVALALAIEPADPRIAGAVALRGAPEVCREIGSTGTLDGADLTVAAERLRELDPAAELARANQVGLRFVVPSDDEWPPQLDDLEHGPELVDRGGVPLGLWVRGPVRLDRLTSSVAVVGSRSATEYGRGVARELSARVAAEGWTVVSGAALGIDEAAHRGALAGGGTTVTVLACGADRVYPAQHERLIEHLAEHGAVVSEAPPGALPMRLRFLTRNRIIAALTRGTVVVEAAPRSGALNTAGWADGISRPVMGVPGPVTSMTSAGVHVLLRRGATVVTNGEEVLETVGGAGEHLTVDLRGPERPRDRLSTPQQQVLDAVPAYRPGALASIARIAGLTTEVTARHLADLDRLGFAEEVGGGWRITAYARA